MQRKLNRVLDLQPASRFKAEKELNISIRNLTYGDEGYIFTSNTTGKRVWLPKEVIDMQSEPYTSNTEKAEFLCKEISELLSILCSAKFHGRKKLKDQLINLINVL